MMPALPSGFEERTRTVDMNVPIDGATTLALMSATENWEPTPWIIPWQPKELA